MDNKEEKIENQTKIEKKKKTFREKLIGILIETIETIVFVIVAVIIIRFFIGELRWIPSGSMHPTLLEKDRVFVEKMSRWIRPLQRGDIIVFYPPDERLEKTPWSIFTRLTGIFCKDLAYIKRIVGMPGETFEIKKDSSNSYAVYINGKKLNEPYILSEKDWTKCSEIVNCGPTKIPKGRYFMMGDNRGNSQDSRYWGTLPADRVIGRSNLIFWPLNRVQMFKTIKTYN